MSSDLNDSSSSASLILNLPVGLKNSAEARAAAKAMAADVWVCNESDFELVFEPGFWVPEKARVEGVPVLKFHAQKAAAIKTTKRRLFISFLLALIALLTFGTLISKGEEKNHANLELLESSTSKLKTWTQQETINNASIALNEQLWGAIKPNLEVDLNPVFHTIENIKLPQVRLRNMEVNASTRNVVLIYEFPSMNQIGLLHKSLSQENSQLSCQLVSIQSANTAINGHWHCTF